MNSDPAHVQDQELPAQARHPRGHLRETISLGEVEVTRDGEVVVLGEVAISIMGGLLSRPVSGLARL